MKISKLNKVESSNLDSVGYDEEDKVLTIKFNKGGVYNYYGVDKKIYDELMKAESKGKYFHKKVKGKFKYLKVDDLL